jgi:MFS family permease
MSQPLSQKKIQINLRGNIMNQKNYIPLKKNRKNGGVKDLEYKWTALTVVIIASIVAMINITIVLISLPAIFNGINIDPLNSFQYLLWILMGYGLIVATLLLSFGRLSDMYGRIKMFKRGFIIFTVGSVLLFLTPSYGRCLCNRNYNFQINPSSWGSFLHG